MPRKRSYADAGLTRRTFTLSLPVAALGTPVAAVAAAPLPISALWDRWRLLRAAMDVPAGDGDDTHIGIEAELYLVVAEVIDALATDLPAIMIKLSVLLGMAPIECGQDEEFPWPQIRSVLKGLQHQEAETLG